MRLSVLIPSRNERFLNRTIDDLFAKAAGEIEVVAFLDGPPFEEPPAERPGLTVLHGENPIGLRKAVNACAEVARGEWLMKCDAHCAFSEGFDEVLLSEIEPDWVVVPRRHSLDVNSWGILRNRQPKDYHYLSCPLLEGNNGGLHGRVWDERRRERHDILIDFEQTSQGSCWLMSAKWFHELLGGFQIEGYGDFIQEFQEIGMKTWLGGGQVMVNKKAFYCHLHKGATWGRGYRISKSSWSRGLAYSTDLWLNNRWKDRIHDFSWLIEKFWPVPTWPDDWEKQLYGIDHKDYRIY